MLESSNLLRIAGPMALALPCVCSTVAAQGSVLLPEDVLQPANAAPGDQFGQAFALDGDLAVFLSVANPQLHVFERVGTAWLETAALTPSGVTGPQFGAGLDVSDQTIVFWPQNTFSPFGVFHVFTRVDGTWSEQILTASGEYFASVATVDGDTIVVGEPNGSHTGVQVSGPGKVHVFERSGSSFAATQEIVDPNQVNWGDFGASLDLCGDTLVVSEGSDSLGNSVEGGLYFFERTGNTFTLDQTIVGTTGFVALGRTLSLDGDRLAAGTGGTSKGSFILGDARIFERIPGGQWDLTAILRPETDTQNDRFPGRVSLSGDTLIASLPDDQFPPRVTSVLAYRKQQGTWSVTARLQEPSLVGSDGYGPLDSDGDTVLVTAPKLDGATGKAFVFDTSLARE